MSVLIELPGYTEASFTPVDFSSVIEPAFGGPAQLLLGVGDRLAITYVVPPLFAPDEGRRILSQLRRARKEGGICAIPLSVKPGPLGTPTVNGAVTGGTSLPLSGLAPNCTILEGLPFNVIKGGRRYIYWTTGQVTANGSGQATVPIDPMLRTQLAGGEAVDFRTPMIEGLVGGDSAGWTKAASAQVSFVLTIREQY